MSSPRLIRMLFPWLLGVWLVAVITPQSLAETFSGRIRSIDLKAGQITLTGTPYVTLRFRVSVEVSINGQQAKLEHLVPGLKATVTSHEPGFANAIAADGPVQTTYLPKATSEGAINVNTASPSVLDELPGIGPALAATIIASRPFKSIDDLDRVPGIGAKTLEKLRPFVRVK